MMRHLLRISSLISFLGVLLAQNAAAQTYPFFPPPNMTYAFNGSATSPLLNLGMTATPYGAGTQFLSFQIVPGPTGCDGIGNYLYCVKIGDGAASRGWNLSEVAPSSGQGGVFQINSANGVGGNSAGGSLDLYAGNAAGSGNGGSVGFEAGNGGTNGAGGAVNIAGGASGASGGNSGGVTIDTQNGTTGVGALIINGGNITANSSSASGGNITLTAGNGPLSGGTGGGGVVSINGGAGQSASSVGGDVYMIGGAGPTTAASGNAALFDQNDDYSLAVDGPGNVFVTSANSTSATDQFTYLGIVPGVPTGVPAHLTGNYATGKPYEFDTTDNRLYVYNGGWKDAAATPSALSTNGTVALNTSGANTTTIGNSSNTGKTVFNGLATGTNADFLCLSSGGVVLLQSSACTISSLRFKRNVDVFTDDALAELDALQVRSYQLIGANRDPNADRTQIGLIAENIAAVEPRCAIYEDDLKTPKSYRPECITALLVSASQEYHRKSQLQFTLIYLLLGLLIATMGHGTHLHYRVRRLEKR